MFEVFVYIFLCSISFLLWVCSKKLDSENEIQDELQRKCKILSKENLIDKLNQGYRLDRSFHLRLLNILRYISRKCKLPEYIIDRIYQDIVYSDVDCDIKFILAQTIKYSIKKGDVDIEIEKLFEILEKSQDIRIRSEVVWMLGYHIRNSFSKSTEKLIDENLMNRINSILERVDISTTNESMEFFNEQIRKQYYVNDTNVAFSIRKKVKMPIHNTSKPIKAAVTKSQQTIKVKSKNKESEESIDTLSSMNFFKNRKRDLKINSNKDILPTLKDKEGSDQSWKRTTKEEVAYLHDRATRGYIIKKKDKDEYLPEKFLGISKKWFLNAHKPHLEGLSIDKMISEIFLEISKKQILPDRTISLLMECVDNMDTVEKKLFDGLGKIETVQKYMCVINEMKIYQIIRVLPENDTNENDILKTVDSDLKVLRINAIKAIYNCTVRTKTILNGERLQKIQNCVDDSDKDTDFQYWILKILELSNDNTNVDHKKLFNAYLNQLKKSENISSALRYIYEQSKDEKRSEELFTDDSITIISALLNETDIDEKLKTDICTIINNYLQYSFSRGLNEEHFRNYSRVLKYSECSEDLKIEALRSIVLTVEKNKNLPKFILFILLDNINQGNDKFDNLVILVLGIVSEQQIIPKIDNLAKKLLLDWVIVRDGADIMFEQSSQDNTDCQWISSIVAQMFVTSLLKTNIINDKSIEYLIQALDSKDKQTCILSAKSLYLAAKDYEINDANIFELKEHIENSIHDVSVYSTAAYIRSLVTISSSYGFIMDSHVSFLPRIFVFKDLQLGQESFADEINKSILFLLHNEAANNPFEDDVFRIFDHILLYDNRYQTEAIEILRKYSAQHFLIPDDTIIALENAIAIPELFDKVLKVFENMISNKQSISEKILRTMTDDFYLSHDKKSRDRSFHLLNMASDNQDISDDIFDIVELENISRDIESHLWDAHNGIIYLCEKTKNGTRLTINSFEALSKLIDRQSIVSDDILKILLNVSNNRQIIPNSLVEKLVKRFKPKQAQDNFTNIFENLVKNNQDISSRLSFKLAQALENPLVSEQVLFIFLLQGQKGKRLPEKVIRKLLHKFLILDNPLNMQQYLPVICSVIEKKDYFGYKQRNIFDRILYQIFGISIIPDIQQAFSHALKTDHQDAIRKSLSGIKTLVSLTQVELNDDIIEILLNLLTSIVCDDRMKQDISQILNTCELEKYQQCSYELANLNYDTDEQLLNKLAEFDKPRLFLQNFNKISHIIDTHSELNLKALNILLKCSNKENITDLLLHNIAVLLASTNSESIKSLCCQLITEIVEAGRIVTDEIILLILVLDETKKPIEILKLISKNQMISDELKEKIRLFSDINPTMNIDTSTLREYLNNMRTEYERSQIFSYSSIQKLLSLRIFDNDNENNLESDLIDIYALVIIQNPKYSSYASIVDRLEKSIISKIITQYILDAYKEIIKQTKCQTNQFSSVLEAFNDILDHDDHYAKYHADILICIALASNVIQLSRLDHLENNLENDNEIIRSWSFRGLRAAHEKGLRSLVFQTWCDNTIEQLKNHTNTDVSFDLDLLETLASVKFIDFQKILYQPQTEWNREFLIFDLVERLTQSPSERFQLYDAWLDIEKNENFKENKSDLLLKLLHRTTVSDYASFTECYEVLKILKKIDFISAHHILLNSANSFVDLYRKYLKEMIDQRLLNKGKISNEYIETLVSNMISDFGFTISQKIIGALKTIDSLIEFEKVMHLAKKNRINVSDIYMSNTTVSILKRSLEIKFLGNKIKAVDRFKLAIHLDKLLDRNWTFEQLSHFFNISQESTSQNKVRYFMNVLEMLSDYGILSKQENDEKILKVLENPAEHWLKEMNKIAVAMLFSDKVQVKTSRELIRELQQKNSDNINMKEFNEEKLSDLIEKIKSSNITSWIFKKVNRAQKLTNIAITEWTFEHIRQWANTVKEMKISKNTEEFFIEVLAVIKRANFLQTDFHITDAQILSCLLVLKANPGQGRLLQVGTGEGKSTIISVLAVVYALQGKTVDIITSSPVLAERDAKQKEKFYSMFDLQCSHNADKAVYVSGPKACYRKQIVYGEAAQFQFDTLRTEYAQLNTLAGRKCEVAIVDEVDSMLIDDSSKIARLATNMSGMDQLQIIYYLLWNQLISMQDRIIQLDNRMYLVYGKIRFEQKRIVLEYANEEGDIVLIEDLKDYLASNSDISHIGLRIPENTEGDAFLKKNLDDYIRSFLKKNIKIPKNFEDFVDTQIPKWIDNAITAFIYQENVHYIVHDGLIKPVDFYSTGIVQSSSNWSDGLHQFLQIKHNLKMTSETFTTNFLSNRGYFTKYGLNLFGLTGTLGSDKAKEVLADVYHVDLVIIPNMSCKQHLSLPDAILPNDIDWLKEICHSAIKESSKERGTLIICETIEHSKIIGDKLQQEYRSSAIKLYTMNDMNQEKSIETIYPGEIIIATNLAGRGTDIKTDQIEQYGGLHVIVTFMPSNKRVEEQAFGRTSRQGKRGTSQKILNAINLTHYGNFNIEKITKRRDELEAHMLSEFEKCELKVITVKDELFVKFCSLLRGIRRRIRINNGIYNESQHNFVNEFMHIEPSVLESNLLLSIEEQWAMFLRRVDNEPLPIDSRKVYDDYENFSNKILDDYEKDCIIKNPYYHINIANDLIINDWSLNNKYDEAMKHIERAIELDPNHCAAAFAGKAWLLIKGRERFLLSNKQDFGYKEQSVLAFRRALAILAEEMALLTSMQTLVQQRGTSIDAPLVKQLVQKVNILGSYCNSLENAVSVITKSRRLIQITEIIDCPDTNGDTDDNRVLQKIILHNSIEKGIGKWCDIRLIKPDHIKNHKLAIENCEEIAIVKKDEDIFIVIFREKSRKKIAEWTVDEHNLKNYLLSLSYDEKILDRDSNIRIYRRIYEKIKFNKGCIRADFLTPLETLPKHHECEVTFNNLTAREDSGMRDQAIETIDSAIKDENTLNLFFTNLSTREVKTILQNNYENINVSVSRINSEILKDLINPNIEIQEVKKDIAIAQLKEKSSFFHRHLLPECLSRDSCKVNLEIVQDNKKVVERSDLEAQDAIKIIEEQKDDNIRCNLTLIAANEISTILQNDVLAQSKLCVEFLSLNGQNVLDKLKVIASKCFHLEIFSNKQQLLKIIDSSLDIENIELHSNETNQTNYEDIKEIVSKALTKSRINDAANNIESMRLIDLSKKTVEAIVEGCPNGNFNISFIDVDFRSLLKGLNDETVSFQFDKLKKGIAKTLIKQIRKLNLDFTLKFKQLTSHQAQRIIEIAQIDQENIEVNKVQTLRELFMNEFRPDMELLEFSGRGIEYLIEISEKRFIPWLSVASVALIGLVQIAVGGILITTGFGATLGMSLVTEGVSDLFTAYRAYSTRQFNWSDYSKQKAVSLIISATTMGLSAIKDAAKGAQTLVTGATQEVLEQAGTKLVTSGKSVGTTLIQTGKNLKSLTIKYIGVTAGEAAVRESLNVVVDFGSNFLLDQVKPQISTSIQKNVHDKFFQSKLYDLLSKMYAIDVANEQQQLKDKINKIVIDIINPEHSFWRKQWDSIGGPLCKGILSSVDRIRGPASMGFRILGTLNGLHEITIIIDNVHDKLFKKLAEIDQETLSVNQIIHRYCSVSKDDAIEIASLLGDQGIGQLNDELKNNDFPMKLTKVDLQKFNHTKNKITEYLTLLHRNMLNLKIDDFSEIMKLVSDTITQQIFQITQSQLISPWSSYGVGELTKALSESVQHHFIVDEKQNSDSQNREIEEQGYNSHNTIAQQLQSNARDYTILYSQCEIIHYSQQQQQQQQQDNIAGHGKVDEKTKQYADSVRNDQPADLSDMIGLAALNGLDIKIVDDEQYRSSEEDLAKGTKIIVYKKGETNSEGKTGIGHFRLMLENGDVVDTPNQKNDCGYSVIKKLLDDQGSSKFIEDLRNSRAQMIEKNPEQFSKICQVQHWVEARYPQESNILLVVGGARKEKKPSKGISSNDKQEEVGTYSDLDKKWRGRKGKHELNHIPPKACYKGTMFGEINPNDMPVIVMTYDDHRNFISTRSKEHRDKIQNFIKQGDMYNAMKLDLSEMLKVGSPKGAYADQVKKFIAALPKIPIKNAPYNKNGTRTLITAIQARALTGALFP